MAGSRGIIVRLLGVFYRRSPVYILIRIVFVIGFSYWCFTYALIPIRVTGISMEPAFLDGQINFINRLAYRSVPPKRLDVVGIRYPHRDYLYLKRIIALPKEALRIEGGVIYIGGLPLREPYVKKQSDWNMGKTIYLKSNEYFVIGDNREMALEDHALGIVPREYILGKVLRLPSIKVKTSP